MEENVSAGIYRCLSFFFLLLMTPLTDDEPRVTPYSWVIALYTQRPASMGNHDPTSSSSSWSTAAAGLPSGQAAAGWSAVSSGGR